MVDKEKTIKGLMKIVVARGQPANFSDTDVHRYDDNSDEFELLMLIAEKFVQSTKHRPVRETVDAHRIACVNAFEAYVREHYSELADVVACDDDVYNAVLIEWVGN